LSIFFGIVFILGMVVGWKFRGIWERRPRWLRWLGREPEAAKDTQALSSEKKGVVDRMSGVGESLVDKVMRGLFGKPKGGKEDS